MKKLLICILCLGCCLANFSQQKELKYNRPFVIFEGCEEVEDKEKCFDEKSSLYVFESLNDSLRTKLIQKSKKDTITISIRYCFDEYGSILIKESNIRSSVDSTSKDLKYILSKFPKTKPVLDEFDHGVATYHTAFYGFKIDSTRTILEAIPNFEPSEVSFQFLGKFPVFDGCPKHAENDELRKCMNQKLMHYIQKNFRSDMILSITGLPEGINSIFLFFKIDKEGNIKAANVRAPHHLLRDEGYRLIENMPNAKSPGKVNGKAVDVLYFLPIKFVVEGKSKQKKSRRKRKS